MFFSPFFSFSLKKLHYKELTSGLVGLSFYGLDTLSLSLIQIAWTRADQNLKERKLSIYICPFFSLVTNIKSQLFLK